jgi:hypothetical protein
LSENYLLIPVTSVWQSKKGLVFRYQYRDNCLSPFLL